MNFGEQIKRIRQGESLTQEQFATQLNVSRQTVSSWENNRNLPDLEMIVEISRVFNCTLDQLILGGNNMTEKLIKDGNENRRMKMNLIGVIIGAFLVLIGAGCIVLKGMTVEYVDADGFLHENFFLLPIGMLFLTAGILTFLIMGLKGLVKKAKESK